MPNNNKQVNTMIPILINEQSNHQIVTKGNAYSAQMWVNMKHYHSPHVVKIEIIDIKSMEDNPQR